MLLMDCRVLDPDSGDGRHLLLRTEFHGQSEYRTSTIIARRLKEDSDIPQSKLLMGKASTITSYISILIYYVQDLLMARSHRLHQWKNTPISVYSCFRAN